MFTSRLDVIDQKYMENATFNAYKNAITRFVEYLQSREFISRFEIDVSRFYRPDEYKHINLSVSQEVVDQILTNLHKLPYQIRLLFLHNYSLGLRVTEVCTIRAENYGIDNGIPFLMVKLYKSKDYKKIPIPMSLYEIMTKYISATGIKKGFVFRSKKGNAFPAGTYVQKMVKFCKDEGIALDTEYFRSHAYRHTIATSMYNHGVSIQTIRDFLGHGRFNEDMTIRYIDTCDDEYLLKSRQYFDKRMILGEKKDEAPN